MVTLYVERCVISLIGLFVGVMASQYADEMVEYSLPVITSDLKIAADLGYKIISKGGNAVDGAVTTALAVGAINSFASGLGGGGFLLLMKEGDCTEYNFRETAPNSATAEKYNIPMDSFKGPRSVAIPCELFGLYSVHLEHGLLPWKDLFSDVIDMMENGFQVPPILASKIKEFEDVIWKDAGLRGTYVRNGRIVQENDVITRKNFARTLKILSEDPDSFYNGEIGDSLLAFINREQVYIEKEELRNVRVIKKPVEPAVIDAETDLYTTSLPSTGYMLRIALSVMSRIKKKKLPFSEIDLQKYLINIYNELYHIRSQLDDLKDERKNIEAQEKQIKIEETVDRIMERVEGRSSFVPYMNNFKPDHGTTHINVIDKEGMMVALTSTINQYWGSGLMDPATGIILNDQIDDFTFKNFSNGSSIQSTAEYQHKNRVNPQKQPLSSAMPSFIRIGKVFLVLGSSGGIRIPTAVISTLSRIIVSGLTIKEAIDHPRLHYQGGNILKLENKYTSTLPNMGIPWKIVRDGFGVISSCVHIVKYDTERKVAYAIADKRKHASVSAVPTERYSKRHLVDKLLHPDRINISYEILQVKTPLDIMKK